jgi:hypothetical protein
MEPGDIDWVIGSPAAFVHDFEGQSYYTDYAKAWAQNNQADAPQTNTDPQLYIFAHKADVVSRTNDYYWGGFMGKPIYSVYKNLAARIHGGLIYKIQGGSYAAVALPIIKAKVGIIKTDEYILSDVSAKLNQYGRLQGNRK